MENRQSSESNSDGAPLDAAIGGAAGEATTEKAFLEVFKTVKRLRSPGGCPWDLEQSPETLRGSLIEESYECIEAIDSRDPEHIKEELGDIFLLAVMLSYMFEQGGAFTLASVLDGLTRKLIRRHPHVFGEVKVRDSEEVLKNWAKIKVEQEGRAEKNSALDKVSRALPPLERAFQLQKKAAKTGFDWPDASGVLAKLKEELIEVEEALGVVQGGKSPPRSKPTVFRYPLNGAPPRNAPSSENGESSIESELGDLLFSVINLCRYLNIDPSIALQGTNTKFYNRFRYVEQKMKENGKTMSKEELDSMEEFWQEAKNQENR